MKPVTIALSGLIDVFQPTPKPTFQLIHKKFFFGGWVTLNGLYETQKCIICPKNVLFLPLALQKLLS